MEEMANKITQKEINDLRFEKANQKALLLKMIRLEREKVATRQQLRSSKLPHKRRKGSRTTSTTTK